MPIEGGGNSGLVYFRDVRNELLFKSFQRANGAKAFGSTDDL